MRKTLLLWGRRLNLRTVGIAVPEKAFLLLSAVIWMTADHRSDALFSRAATLCEVSLNVLAWTMHVMLRSLHACQLKGGDVAVTRTKEIAEYIFVF
jgi:hypothetical protein